MNISDGKHIDLEDIDTIIHEEESKHNPNNDQIDTGDGDDDDDTILDNSGNIKVEDTALQTEIAIFLNRDLFDVSTMLDMVLTSLHYFYFYSLHCFYYHYYLLLFFLLDVHYYYLIVLKKMLLNQNTK